MRVKRGIKRFSLCALFVVNSISGTAFANGPWQVTTDGGDYPDFSPDGSMIAYQYSHNIFVIPTRGGTPVDLTEDYGYNQHPAWSPDGTKIACASTRDSDVSEYDIVVMPVESSSTVNLTYGNSEDDLYPAWSHDGSLIAYSIMWGGVYTIPSSGGEPSFLSSNKSCPDWFSAGDKVIVNGGFYLYTVTYPGGDETLIDESYQAYYPSLSPDSSSVVFFSKVNRLPTAVYAMPVTGGDWVQISPGIGEDENPDWSPGGELIAYSSDQDGERNIWVAEVPTVDIEPDSLGSIKATFR